MTPPRKARFLTDISLYCYFPAWSHICKSALDVPRIKYLLAHSDFLKAEFFTRWKSTDIIGVCFTMGQPFNTL